MIKSFEEFILTEAKTYPIYHGVSAMVAEEILKSGRIEGRTLHLKSLVDANYAKARTELDNPPFGTKGVRGISTTRNFEFARKWGGDQYGVVLELNTEKIDYKHRIVPVNWHGIGTGVTRQPYGGRLPNEFEEFVIADRLPVKGIVKKIYIGEGLVDEDWPEYHDIMKVLRRLYGASAKSKVEIGRKR